MKRKMFVGATLMGAIILAAGPATAATTTQRVIEPLMRDGYPANPSASDASWYRQDTRVGGGAILTRDFGAPGVNEGQDLGDGALALTTNDKDTAKAQLFTYNHVYGTPLSDVTDISYWVYHSSLASGFSDGEASFQVTVDVDGDLSTTADRTTLVYEPYYNDTEGSDPQGAITPDTWQFFDTIGGDWWSTHDITCGDFTVAATPGGPPNTRIGDVADNCDNATVLSIGVNVGTFNPNYIAAVDGIHFETSSNAYFWDFGPK